MLSDLSEELITQDDHVLPVSYGEIALWIAVEPDMGLVHKMETGFGEQFGAFICSLAAKEDRASKDPFDAGHEASVFLSSLLHGEHLQHFRAGSESKGLALLADSEGLEEDQDQSVLAEREAELRVSKQLKFELAIATFEEELATRRAPHRQTAKHEWPGGEPEPNPSPLSISPKPVDNWR